VLESSSQPPESSGPPPEVTPAPAPEPTPEPPPEPTPPPPPAIPAIPGHCRGWNNAVARADLLLAGRYWLAYHPTVALGLDPTWREDPLGDKNWEFMHHSLQVVSSLLEGWADTGRADYLARAEFLLSDWVEENPRLGSVSIWAWNDHSTALRAAVLACASIYLTDHPWLQSALVLHGETLADPLFYVNHGNHALNQSIGLLEVANVLGRADWKQLATNRIAALILESVDSQGVTNEQSVAYQWYNLGRYRLAEARLNAMDLPIPASFSRLDQMPKFLAHATRPDGNWETIGDTDTTAAVPIPGTWAEFAATRGTSGPKPGGTLAIYRAGYLFARSGWGEKRAFADEVFLSLRFGPAPIIHGHADGTGITFYGYGSRLLIDPGKYSYNYDPYRTFFKGRTAHNVVTVDGLSWNSKASTTLVKHRSSATMVDAITTTSGYKGVRQQRRVTFSRKLNYVLVEDRASSTIARRFRQLWHLSETANPLVSTSSFRTRNARGNVLIRQLIPVSSSGIVKGRTRPVQGWLSHKHGSRTAAPVVEVVKSGTSVRYLTLIVPAAGQPSARVSGLRTTATGYSVVVTIGGRSERVTVSATGASIVPLN
jgi:hypothetical protein